MDIEWVGHFGFFAELVRAYCLHNFLDEGRIGGETKGNHWHGKLEKGCRPGASIVYNRKELSRKLNVLYVINLFLVRVFVRSHPVLDLSE